MANATAKKATATLAIITILALTGCSVEQEATNTTNNAYITEHVVELADGRTVDCLVFKQGYGGGVSCDWAGTK